MQENELVKKTHFATTQALQPSKYFTIHYNVIKSNTIMTFTRTF